MITPLTRLRPGRKFVRLVSLSLALVVSGSVEGLLLVCAPETFAAQNPAASKERGDDKNASQNNSTHQNNATEDSASRPRRIDSAQTTAPDGPMIRVGLMIDVAAVSISSVSGLVVRRPQADNRASNTAASYTVASGEMRVEARRLVAASVARLTPSKSQIKSVAGDDNSKYKPRSRYTEASNKPEPTSRPGATGKPDATIKPDATMKAAEKDESSLTSHVVAFEANAMIASSESMLIVAASDEQAALGEKSVDKDSKIENRSEKRSQRPNQPQPNQYQVGQPRPVPAVRVGNKDYRGEIHLVLNSRGRLNVVNRLPLEEYLRGVVPRELSPGVYPLIEALKAQAVAARSYALANLGRYGKEGFDLRDDAQSQVYDGLSAEHPLTNRAVEETRGIAVVYRNEDGRVVPIEALYTSTCGGRTENNEAIFLNKAVSYLRSVECAPDRTAPVNREIVSDQMAETLSGPEGQLARGVALMEVLGFSLPRPVTSKYLRGAVDEDELMSWMERAAKLARQVPPDRGRDRAMSLPDFASLLATALYGASRASLLLSPADVDYILEGMGGEEVPREMRADIAMLLKDGLLRVAADSRLDAKSAVTRAFAIETLVRALTFKVQIPGLKSHTARPAENGRLLLAASKAAPDAKREAVPEGIDVERRVWLFRRFRDLSYAVDRMTIVGGERITYHVNAAGRVDFLEAEVSDRGAASDRLSGQAQWRERVTLAELRSRLGRYRIDVGEIESLTPITYGESNRVLEMEVIGSEGRMRLRGFQIRNAIGLKENLFVIDRETDERGRTTAFVFTGRGWGHGVGMCQTGAAGLAKEGYSYTSILQKYYTNVKVQKVY